MTQYIETLWEQFPSLRALLVNYILSEMSFISTASVFNRKFTITFHLI